MIRWSHSHLPRQQHWGKIKNRTVTSQQPVKPISTSHLSGLFLASTCGPFLGSFPQPEDPQWQYSMCHTQKYVSNFTVCGSPVKNYREYHQIQRVDQFPLSNTHWYLASNFTLKIKPPFHIRRSTRVPWGFTAITWLHTQGQQQNGLPGPTMADRLAAKMCKARAA